MTHQQWSAVSLFYRSLGTAELQAQSAREKSDRNKPKLTDYQRDQINLARRRGKKAKDALEEFSGDHTQKDEDSDLQEAEVHAAGRDGG